MTPMMEQYFEIKKTYKEHILFYRLGDFYEMFFDDAIVASRELELTLTGRDCGEAERAPMCGVPFHSAEGYIGKLIEKGYKVAICEQTEDPSAAKGLVRREVVRVITPGTLIETDLLESKQNNYIAAIYFDSNGFGVCFADVSTAQVYATMAEGESSEAQLINELGAYNPREIILNGEVDKVEKLHGYLYSHKNVLVSQNQSERYEYDNAKNLVLQQFRDVVREDDLNRKHLICSIGAALNYISEMQKSDISYIKDLSIYGDNQYMNLDVNTRRNLELTETMRSKEKKGSLLWVLDKTKTAAGARMLKQWIEHPLLNTGSIQKRLGAVEEMFNHFMMREECGILLDNVLDIERLVTRIVYGTANGRDLRSIASAISIIPELKEHLSGCTSPELSRIYSSLDDLKDIYQTIDEAIVDEPPFSVREGGMIKKGYNNDVDKLRSRCEDGSAWIKQIAEREKERTGIKTLKIGYNRVFGYYIEVSKSFIDQVPETYIRKQTLSNCERYITDDLKAMEATILGASDKLSALEYELFQGIRKIVADNSRRLQKVASELAQLDVYISLAAVASKNKYIKPEITVTDTIDIKDGRHPVVEQFVNDTYFAPNDTLLDTKNNRIMLITGPNMAGKSTYMRQVALITIMAQIGSFVPASEASIGIVDRLFTRVGASDDLASGQSTFMLEMNEVAYILKNATRQSLIIYDEVGRGTSTFDGMSIAKAIVEYTNSKKIGAKTLFATHYHELTTLEKEMDGIVNYNIAAKKRGDSIIFLRKIIKGSTDDSYGIEVAKLAGVPSDVIKRAKQVLAEVENTSKAIRNIGDDSYQSEADDSIISMDDMLREQVIEELKSIDINTLSPYEAMTLLFNLQKRLK